MSKTLIREVRNIALISLALGVIQMIVTIPIGFFGIETGLGTLLGCVAAVLNFALMGIILEKSVAHGKGAQGLMGMGYIFRLIIIAAVILWAIKASYLNWVCTVIPLLFPRIAIYIINFIRRKERTAEKDERTEGNI